MKKLLLFFAPFLLAILVFAGVMFFLNQNSKKGALQVTATPKSKVYLNNTLIGETPLCKCEGKDMLRPGEYSVRLVANEGDFAPYQEKITINPSVLSVMDKSFGQGALGGSKTITLTKLDDQKAGELLVLSFPQDVEVFLDSSSIGKTPFSYKSLSVSDHELRLVREGYREKIIRIRGVAGYKLTVIATLAILPDITEASSSAAPTIASSSALPVVSKIIILNTPTGFLRVREEASLASAETARVAPGEIYDMQDEQNNWYKIKLSEEKSGWVSNQYARKQ